MRENIILSSGHTAVPVIDPRKTVFWVGAGVSRLTPCNLPLGNELTDAYLDAMLGKEYAEQLIALWNNHIPSIRESIQNGCWHEAASHRTYTIEDVKHGMARERPRLEFIIGEMNKLDQEFRGIRFHKAENRKAYARQSSIQALAHFADAEPNIYHDWIAEFVKAGSLVVTSNFDTCIEKALGVDKALLNAPVLVDGVKAIDCGNGQHVYHFHGVATDRDIEKNLGATINNVSKGLSEAFQNKLKQCFQAGCDIIFLGYSGSDFFDVQPFFQELQENHYPGKAIYLHYCQTADDCVRESGREKSYQYLLNPFEQQIICYGATETFFKRMGLGAGIGCSKTPSKIPGTAYAHMQEALRQTTLHLDPGQVEKFQFLNMLRLLSQLNISLNWFYPDWVEQLEEIYEDWKNDAPDQMTLQKMAQPAGQMNDRIIDDIFYNNWHSRKNAYRRIIQELKPLVAKWNRSHQTELSPYMGWGHSAPADLIESYVTQTCHILECGSGGPAQEHVERSTVHYLCGRQTKKLFIKWALLVFSRPKIERELKALLGHIDRLLAYPFNHFLYRTYYLSLCRQHNAICAILGTGSSDSKTGCYGNLQHEWNICMETPNLFDAGKTIVNRIVQMLFMGFRGEKVELGQIYQLWNIRKKLMRLRKG